MSIIIRRIGPGDAEGLADFYNGLSGVSKRTFRPLGEKTTVERCRAIVEENALDPANKYDLVACDAERIVGWGFLWNLQSEIPTVGLGVADTWQGRGLGRTLMDRVIAFAREQGLRRISLTVVQDNAKARKMYERRGFVKQEEFVGEDGLPYYHMVAGLEVDVERKKNGMICAGIDAGSRAIKIVLLDAETSEVIASGIHDQGVEQDALTQSLLDSLLAECGLTRNALGRVVATGYGRNLLRFADTTVTEITCHALGVRHVAPDVMTIIEVGGQDSKLIRLTPKGTVRDFAMNDRCAAGTGRFLEVVASRIGVGLADLGPMAARSQKPASISSTCVVFAETEIVGLLASGIPAEDIVAGVQRSIARRVAAMAGRVVETPIVFTGGVAMISGMAEALESVLERPVRMAPDPQMTGALGAAILAARQQTECATET